MENNESKNSCLFSDENNVPMRNLREPIIIIFHFLLTIKNHYFGSDFFQRKDRITSYCVEGKTI